MGWLQKWLILSVLSYSTLTCQPSQDVSSIIQKIPKEDRECLATLFRGLLSYDEFGATLFGYKPIASFDYVTDALTLATDTPDLFSQLFRNFALECKGWKIWQKYQHLFPMHHYLFLFKKHPYAMSFLFVHQEAMHMQVERYRELYDWPELPPEEMLQQVFSNEFLSAEFYLARGLLFGYDVDSCVAFQRREQLDETLFYFPYAIATAVPRGPVILPKRDGAGLLDGSVWDLAEEREHFDKNFISKKVRASENPFSCARPYGYNAFEIPVESNGSELMQKVNRLYNSDNFLEEFLTILMK